MGQRGGVPQKEQPVQDPWGGKSLVHLPKSRSVGRAEVRLENRQGPQGPR